MVLKIIVLVGTNCYTVTLLKGDINQLANMFEQKVAFDFRQTPEVSTKQEKISAGNIQQDHFHKHLKGCFSLLLAYFNPSLENLHSLFILPLKSFSNQFPLCSHDHFKNLNILHVNLISISLVQLHPYISETGFTVFLSCCFFLGLRAPQMGFKGSVFIHLIVFGF